MAHILVVDDDGDLRALLKTALERDGHQVSLLDRGGAVSEAHCRWADCILLDVMMPGEDGFATCRRIRALAACPILFLTAKTEEADVLTDLGLGGDDYLSKPFDLDIFQARLDALVRRTRRDESAQREGLRFLELTLWTNTRTARIGDGKLDLHGKQFDFLYYLVENKNVIVHKERLFQRVWGFYSATDFSVVEVYASQIRKLLRQYDYEKYLKTVRGIGYILTDDSELYG